MRSFWAVVSLLCFLNVGGSAQQNETFNLSQATSHEDWTTLSIRSLGLASLPPMPGGKSELPEFTREFVRLQWRTGDPVDVFVVLPRAVTKPHVVLYLYGYPSNLDRFRNDQWCKAAVEGGFAAVGFVSAMTGERYQNRPMKQWFVSELQESFAETTHDVQEVLNYLEQRADLTTDRIGMYAQGSGASIAILAASVDSRIAVLDLLNPWGDWPDWFKQSLFIPEAERPSYIRPEFLEKVELVEPAKVLPSLSGKTIRIQQVADDPIVPKAPRENLASVLPHGAQLLQYDNNAAFRKAWQDKKLWAWMKEQLGQPSFSFEQRASQR